MTIRNTDSEMPSYEHHRPARLQEEIRQHAYQIWEEHGRPEGEALHDWLRAEQEILSHEVMGETGVEENRPLR